jgi:CTP synthase
VRRRHRRRDSTPDAPSIYDIPKVLHREELDAYVVRRLNLPFRDVDWTQWNDLLQRVRPAGDRAHRIGGQVHRPSDAYLSVAEALRACGFKHRAKVEMRWVASDDCET